MSKLLLDQNFRQLAAQIKLIIFDVDGIFTDGKIYLDDKGIEIKAFHVLDGQGIKLLQQTAIDIAVISGRNAPGVTYRMQQLGIKHIFQGHTDKLPIYQALLNKLNLQDHDVAHMGDDLPDLPLLKRVKLPITVPNAVPEVLQTTPWMTEQHGGCGAVREVCESLIKSQGLWENIMQQYSGN